MSQEIIDRWTELGQEHLFAHWQERGEERRRRLVRDLEHLEPSLLDSLRRRCDKQPVVDKQLDPHPYVPEEHWRNNPEARAAGEDLLDRGMAGFLTVAGGQGSRLGYAGPKGAYRISPLRRASLFQILAEKILAARRRYGRATPWYVMGGPHNLEDIVAFFRKNGFFGLPEGEVSFFSQGSFPTLSTDGKLLLAADGGLFENPNGHGGVLQALHESGLLCSMEDGGIEELFYTQVDNPLVQVPDAAFLGMHRLRRSEMSSKVVPKEYPDEKLGVIGLIDGKPGIIEYSDLDQERTHARDSAGRLLYSHGSIAIHVLNVGFVRRLDYRLPLHQARKHVESWIPGPGGGRLAEREAIKFERFIFDAIPEAENPLFLETDRAEEFAPLKNRTGVDSIETCREGMLWQHVRWLEQAGIRVPHRDGRPAVTVEISPLFACGPEDLKKRLGTSVNRIDEDTLLA